MAPPVPSSSHFRLFIKNSEPYNLLVTIPTRSNNFCLTCIFYTYFFFANSKERRQTQTNKYILIGEKAFIHFHVKCAMCNDFNSVSKMKYEKRKYAVESTYNKMNMVMTVYQSQRYRCGQWVVLFVDHRQNNHYRRNQSDAFIPGGGDRGRPKSDDHPKKKNAYEKSSIFTDEAVFCFNHQSTNSENERYI